MAGRSRNGCRYEQVALQTRVGGVHPKLLKFSETVELQFEVTDSVLFEATDSVSSATEE